jgi:hypothetical protein
VEEGREGVYEGGGVEMRWVKGGYRKGGPRSKQLGMGKIMWWQ